MQHLEGSGTPVLYIGRRFLNVKAHWKLQQAESSKTHANCCTVFQKVKLIFCMVLIGPGKREFYS